MFEFEKEKITMEEAEKMIEDLKENYIEDGFSENISRSMAIANLKQDYEW